LKQGDIVGETLLTIKQVAARLALGRTTVYELITKQEIRTIKIGRARRVPESAVEQWIAQQVLDQEPEMQPPAGGPKTR
jgi:excisionase family DNA binding protein